MLKRAIDILVAALALILLSPLLIPVAIAIWSLDRHSPFYVASRVTKGMKTFKMVKFRSMIKDADRSGVDSTGADDMRVTGIGRFIRRYKIDELPQLWNVLNGDMSIVGPRPNVEREVRLYTEVESRLLSARPGITDLASIVFSDEGEILTGHKDPDIAYNQLIRPGKSKLGLFYIKNQSTKLDIQIVILTLLNVLNREKTLLKIVSILRATGATEDLIELAHRKNPLVPAPPPGSEQIVTSRDQ